MRDMRGGRELGGRAMCLKIFDKDRDMKPLQQELLAYKALSKYAEANANKWAPYVMRLEASLEEPYDGFLAMVSSSGCLFFILWRFNSYFTLYRT